MPGEFDRLVRAAFGQPPLWRGSGVARSRAGPTVSQAQDLAGVDLVRLAKHRPVGLEDLPELVGIAVRGLGDGREVVVGLDGDESGGLGGGAGDGDLVVARMSFSFSSWLPALPLRVILSS
ncbi:hypothetical protein ACG93S_09715 [Streptomyces sp. WAC01490]|uniref:hypothetical protein n=1 Tax=unclassified Streptomyces TaxID=2593676 RepID=UPI003F2E8659